MITIEEILHPKYNLHFYPQAYQDRMLQRLSVLSTGMEVASIHWNDAGGTLYLEFGVDTGTTLNHIARYNPARPVFGFDSFEGLPEDWIPGFGKGKFTRHGQPPEKMFKNIEFVVGMFQDTLPAFIQHHQGNIAFLHIDCDLYSSTDFVLRTLQHRIVPGTVIVFDELVKYRGYENHEFKALNEFLERTGYDVKILATNMFEQVALGITATELKY